MHYPGTYTGAVHGWYIFLKPLPPGEHTIRYVNDVRPTTLSGAANTINADITYLMNVKSNQTGNTTLNVPSNDTMLNSNVTNNSSSFNNTIPEQVPPKSINGSIVPKI